MIHVKTSRTELNTARVMKQGTDDWWNCVLSGHQRDVTPGGPSTYTFGYRRPAGIFKILPIHIFNIFKKPYPFIYFLCEF